MYCKECGTFIPQGAYFCPKCGWQVELTPPAVPMTQSPHIDEQKERSRKKVVVIVLAILLATLCIFFIWWFSENSKAVSAAQSASTQAFTDAHTRHAVVLSLDAPDYTSDATRIPVQVTGSDVDGSAVDELCFVDGSGDGIELAQGTYTLDFPASPLLADGSLYQDQPAEVHIAIGEDLAADAPLAVSADQTVAFVKADPADVTDAQIDAAYEHAKKDADNGAAKADNLKQKAIDLRDSAKPVELDNTYTTRFERAAQVTYPAFAFDYPSNWTISDPEIGYFSEIVTLTNERGVVIRYAQLDRGSVSGDGTWRMDIEKVADSSFIPDYVQATDYRGLGTFMVASAVCTGSLSEDGSYTDIANSPMNYAVLPESRVGVAEGLRGDNSSALSFDYALSLSLATVDVQGGLTPRETREVIAILSSFRTA